MDPGSFWPVSALPTGLPYLASRLRRSPTRQVVTEVEPYLARTAVRSLEVMEGQELLTVRGPRAMSVPVTAGLGGRQGARAGSGDRCSPCRPSVSPGPRRPRDCLRSTCSPAGGSRGGVGIRYARDRPARSSRWPSHQASTPPASGHCARRPDGRRARPRPGGNPTAHPRTRRRRTATTPARRHTRRPRPPRPVAVLAVLFSRAGSSDGLHRPAVTPRYDGRNSRLPLDIHFGRIEDPRSTKRLRALEKGTVLGRPGTPPRSAREHDDHGNH